MKKTFLILAIAFTAVSANAQFLFRISGKKIKEPSYILGSVHTLPGSLLDSIPEFIEAESKCRQLYAEYDISSQQSMAQAQAAGQQAISLPEGKNIFDVLNQDQIDLLNTRFKETFQVNFTDSVMKTVWNYQPNVLITTFSLIFTSQEMQKHPELGMTGTPIDMFCINRAKERGLSFGQLDEVQPEDKLKKMRDSLNAKIDVQVDSLVAFLSDMELRNFYTEGCDDKTFSDNAYAAYYQTILAEVEKRKQRPEPIGKRAITIVLHNQTTGFRRLTSSPNCLRPATSDGCPKSKPPSAKHQPYLYSAQDI